MVAKDISDLSHDEVDWEAGAITRKRNKSKDEPNAHKVLYTLWPEAIESLKLHRSQDADRALVTKTGRTWVDRQKKM